MHSTWRGEHPINWQFDECNFQTFFPWHMKYLWNSRHLIITIKSNFTYVMKTSIYYFVIILSPKCCCIYNVCVIFRVLLLIDGFLLWERGLRRISRHMLWVLFNTVLLILVKEEKILGMFRSYVFAPEEI